MAIKQVNIQRFDGGIGTISEKADIANSAKFIKGLNPFEDPSYITQAKKTTKKSSTTVTGLVHWFADGSPWSTNRYAYDSAGKIYQINSSDTVSLLQTTSDAAGEGLLVLDNYLYYALTENLGRYGPLDGTPAFNDDITSWWVAENLQTSGGGTGEADYVPPTTIAETAAARQTFTADHDPIESITIDVDVVGTGNWTVTLHDQANRNLGSETIAVGSMATGDVVFTLDSIARVIPGEEYHFHVTSTVADGGVDTNAATDLEGAEYTITYQPLLDATFHPMAEMLGGIAIGNERYIGYFDNINGEFDPTKIALASGYEVRALYKFEEYIVAEAWKGQSFEEAEEGRRYFWDGIESTFNFFEDITAGATHAGHSYKNNIISICGNDASIYAGSKPMEKITDGMPKLARGKKIEIYPGAITEYEERLLVGVSGVTDDASIEQGVYEFGSQGGGLAHTLNFPYIISTGTTQATTLKIGALGSFGTDLYIGWRDNTSYGIDKVALGDSAYATGSWESRIFDAGDQQKDKQAIKLEITFEALTTGQSVTPKYDINRSGTFTAGTAASTVGDTDIDLYINSQFKEIEFGFNLASTSNTFITITGINFIYNDLSEESDEA